MKENNKSKMSWIVCVRQGGMSPDARWQRPEIGKVIQRSDTSGFWCPASEFRWICRRSM